MKLISIQNTERRAFIPGCPYQRGISQHFSATVWFKLENTGLQRITVSKGMDGQGKWYTKRKTEHYPLGLLEGSTDPIPIQAYRNSASLRFLWDSFTYIFPLLRLHLITVQLDSTERMDIILKHSLNTSHRHQEFTKFSGPLRRSSSFLVQHIPSDVSQLDSNPTSSLSEPCSSQLWDTPGLSLSCVFLHTPLYRLQPHGGLVGKRKVLVQQVQSKSQLSHSCFWWSQAHYLSLRF